MALISCSECKKLISDTAQSCPYCGFDVKPARESKEALSNHQKLLKELTLQQEKHWRQVKRSGICLIVVAGIGIIFQVATTQTVPAEPPPNIPYEVLLKNGGGAAASIGPLRTLDVLVSEKASKQEIMVLAEYLRRKYPDTLVTIFDSRELHTKLVNAIGMTNQQFKESPLCQEMKRHQLVKISWGRTPDWIGTARGH